MLGVPRDEFLYPTAFYAPKPWATCSSDGWSCRPSAARHGSWGSRRRARNRATGRSRDMPSFATSSLVAALRLLLRVGAVPRGDHDDALGRLAVGQLLVR